MGEDETARKRARLAARFGDENALESGFGGGATGSSARGGTKHGEVGSDVGCGISKFASVATPKVVTPTTTAEAPLSYVCEAQDALRFQMWRSGEACAAKEAEDAGEDAFEPEFTHQVFREDESVFGYAGLRVNVHVSRTSLKAMLRMTYTDKIKSAMNPADPVEEQLREWFDSDGLCELYTDEERFKAEAEMAEPCSGGVVVSESESRGVVTKITAYELATNEEARKWHAAMEAYAVFFIDAASKIDNEDPRWTLLVATRHHADGRWETAGYTTVYRFYAYPESERARLSQILVLPPYQRQGLGGKMLEAVRKIAIDRKMRDLTVEDPTDQLQRLRDVHDVKACLQDSDIMAAVTGAASSAARAPTADARRIALSCSKSIFDAAASKLKICKPQMRRVWEALLFIFAKRSKAPENSPVADAFRELIIRRLKAMYTSNSEKDVGTKRIIPIGDTDFVMTKAQGTTGEAPQMENPEEGQADITEVLGELFSECVQNLSFIHAQCKDG